MATILAPSSAPVRAGLNGGVGQPDPEFGADQRAPTPQGWGNAGPLSLLAFAVVTLMLSLINAKAITADVTPVVFGVGLIFGGTTQLIGGLIQLRTQHVPGRVVLLLRRLLDGACRDPPVVSSKRYRRHRQGMRWACCFTPSPRWSPCCGWRRFAPARVVVVALGTVLVTFVLLGAGNYGGHSTLIHLGGYTGILAAALAFYLALAELCEFSYGRAALPVWPLAQGLTQP